MSSSWWPNDLQRFMPPGGPGMLKFDASGNPSLAAQGADYLEPYPILGVDLKTTGSRLLVPVQAGKFFVPRFALVRVKTLTGALVVAPIVRIGNNVNHDNICPLLTLTGAVVGQIFAIPLVTGVSLLAIDIGTTGVSVEVQTGATATTMTGDVYLDGLVT